MTDTQTDKEIRIFGNWSLIKVRPAAAGRASIEEEEGGLGVEEGGPNAGRAGRAGGAGGAGGASGTLVASG